MMVPSPDPVRSAEHIPAPAAETPHTAGQGGTRRGALDSYGSAALRVGADAMVTCYAYPASGPILSITAGRVGVDISIASHGGLTAAAVTFARELARQSCRFADECERLHRLRCGSRCEHFDQANSQTDQSL
ncbi:MAG: hypothetical protein ACYCVZ_01685 [Streptosporangiaceae bacterium]